MAEEKKLEHVGVLGMHWGIRKSRPDTRSPEHLRAQALKKKKVSELTNEELKALTTRMQLEKQFKDLSKTEVSAGKKLVTGLLSTVGKQVMTNIWTKYANAETFNTFVNFAAEAARSSAKRRRGGATILDLKALPG